MGGIWKTQKKNKSMDKESDINKDKKRTHDENSLVK